jgi:hypothetical protein
VTITDLIPVLRGHGTHRAVDEVERLREDNAKLLERQGAADDFFESQDKLITGLEADVRKWKVRAENAERTVGQLEAVIGERDRRIADLERKISIGVNAEHVIAKTQAMDAEEIRVHCAKPRPLHQSPMAVVTDPGRTPHWARDTDTRPLRTVKEAS